MVLAGAVSILIACGGEDSTSTDAAATTAAPGTAEAASATGVAPSATEPTVADSAVTPAPAIDPPVTDAPLAEEPVPVPETAPVELAPAGACPVGSWLVTTEALQGFYDVVGAETGVDFVFAGQVLFTLTDGGAFTYAMTDFELSQNAGGLATTVCLVGDISGTYTADESRFTTSNVTPNVVATATVDGIEIDATPILASLLTEFPVNNAMFVWEGADLVVDFVAVGTTARVRMTPA